MTITVCDHCGKDKEHQLRPFTPFMNKLSYSSLCSDCFNEALERTKNLRELLESKYQELDKILFEYETPTPEFEERLKNFNQVTNGTEIENQKAPSGNPK